MSSALHRRDAVVPAIWLRWRSRRIQHAPAIRFTDVTAHGRHPLRPQRRPGRQEVSARDDGLGRARSSMPMATAGRTSC